MSSFHIRALIVAVLGVAVGLMYITPELQASRTKLFIPWFISKPHEFTELTPGLYKMDHAWYMTPFHSECLDIYMIKQGKSWYLSDGGGHDNWLAKHATQIVEAVEKVMGAGERLEYVVLTHSHTDHVGALTLLLAKYPHLKVAVHEGEAPYLVDGKPYQTLDNASLSMKLLVGNGLLPKEQIQVPESRVVLLKGKEGSLAHLGLSDVKWYHAPGHAPGHVVYLHTPSGFLLAGDVTDVVVKNDALSLMLFCGSNACDFKKGIEALCWVTHHLPYKRILPYHDATKTGFTKPEFISVVDPYAAENGVSCE